MSVTTVRLQPEVESGLEAMADTTKAAVGPETLKREPPVSAIRMPPTIAV
jgi:hypothetical protein